MNTKNIMLIKSIKIVLLFLILLPFSGNSQNLQNKDSVNINSDSLPPIIVTKKAGDLWYDFHYTRINNLYRKKFLYEQQERLLSNCEELAEQIRKAKSESDKNLEELRNEKKRVEVRLTEQDFYIQKLESEYKSCKNSLALKSDNANLLSEMYKKAKRDNFIIGSSGIAAVIITFLILK